MGALKGDTIHIYSWADMAQLGVQYLTGESCAYSMRVLCDLNADGVALITEYFSVGTLAKNWNSQVAGQPAVASVMLHRDSLKQIAEFALFRMGALAVISVQGGEVMGVFDEDMLRRYTELAEKMPLGQYSIRRNYSLRAKQPHVGSRNVHAMSGRTE